MWRWCAPLNARSHLDVCSFRRWRTLPFCEAVCWSLVELLALNKESALIGMLFLMSFYSTHTNFWLQITFIFFPIYPTFCIVFQPFTRSTLLILIFESFPSPTFQRDLKNKGKKNWFGLFINLFLFLTHSLLLSNNHFNPECPYSIF